MKISFKPANRECEVKEGTTVMEAAAVINVPIDGNCSGAGVCGKCKVRVLAGTGNPMTPEEEKFLTARERSVGYRLACKFIPDTDTVVEAIPVGSSVNRKASMMELPTFWNEEPQQVKSFISIPEDTLDDQTSTFDKIQRVLGMKLTASAKVLAKIARTVNKEVRDVTVAVVNEEMIDIEAGDTTAHSYGIAYDIGTTTVVGILWNLNTCTVVGTCAETNPQGVYGADVISRITYIDQKDENLQLLHDKIIECLNALAAKLCAENGIIKEDILRCSVVGNTTMSHIFANVHPHQVSLAPYIPVFCKAVTQKAATAGIDINPEADVYLLPNIAGHVGSDITAGVIATALAHENRNHLMIDIGTNGEIVMAGNGKVYACSTAAGPAFEGASISKGMRAAAGAIETVVIEDGNVTIETIDQKKPIGICGSGIIDAVGQMVKAGIVNKGGKILKPEQMEEKGLSEEIIRRTRKQGRMFEFVLYFDEEEGNDVTITQKDIREVQLAKAAIYTGMEVLMERAGITREEMDQVSIAGAFGSYISIDNALNIGLLPDIPREKIKAIGNAAGVGASMAVLSDHQKRCSEEDAANITHVELAGLDDFQEKYIRATGF